MAPALTVSIMPDITVGTNMLCSEHYTEYQGYMYGNKKGAQGMPDISQINNDSDFAHLP